MACTALVRPAAAETVRAALEAGITLLDVAPHYGQGLAERRLGDGFGQAARGRRRYHQGRPSARANDRARPCRIGRRPCRSRRSTMSAARASSARSVRACARVGRPRSEMLLLHDPDRYAEERSDLRALIAEAYGTWPGFAKTARSRRSGSASTSRRPATWRSTSARGTAFCSLAAIRSCGRR